MTASATLLEAALLGVVEGLTEFLPVSSTGHLILVGYLLGFEGPPGKVFEVVIQFGAIVAICVVYFARLLDTAVALPTSPAARRFAAAILLAFLPALVLGVTFHGFIKEVLFSPWVVVVSLFVGGVLILVIESMGHRPVVHEVTAVPPAMAFKIGFCQALAMIPGVSRSGATILGAMLLGVERRAAAEFSFFLAIPTMLGAAVYDLYKNRALLAADDVWLMAVGFAMALLAAAFVVKALIAYLARHDFRPFGWYRITVALVMAGVLLAWGG
ncbi:MAG TPA: undecaprenyl-diphosphate phosphatase [Geminicoccaceae bacterium]|nr:undecaprenyl-diphosphate phosphatase [Geminicoccaceae bacterium]